MDKPEQENTSDLDYSKCRDYLQEKFNYDERNFAGWTPGTGDNPPYQDFWHYICDRHNPSNGGFIYLNLEELDQLDSDDFKYICLNRYFTEFTEHVDEDGTLTLRTDW